MGKKGNSSKCPRCGESLFDGRCPLCDWPGFKIPEGLSEEEWNSFEKDFVVREAEIKRKNTIRRNAVLAVKKAVACGNLKKATNCVLCGKEDRIEAHHFSYKPEHWLDIVWICLSCHHKWHSHGINTLWIKESLDPKYHHDLPNNDNSLDNYNYWKYQFNLRKKDRFKLLRRLTIAQKETNKIPPWEEFQQIHLKFMNDLNFETKDEDFANLKKDYADLKAAYEYHAKRIPIIVDMARIAFEKNEEFLKQSKLELDNFSGIAVEI